MTEDLDYDVIVIGSGVAGASVAAVLGRNELRVALIDRRAEVAPCFKAEKVEPDQAEVLRKLDLWTGIKEVLTPIRVVASAYRGRVLDRVAIEQYGVHYWELANAIHARIPERVARITARVHEVELSSTRQHVHLGGGSSLSSRIVVAAMGVSPNLNSQLGVVRSTIRDGHSVAFGFDVELENPPRDFDSLTYYSEKIDSRFDYLTLFPIGEQWRANLFSYFDRRDPRLRAFSKGAETEIAAALPRLRSIVGACRVTGKPEAQIIDLYTVKDPPREGVVLVGDAHQSVCPATGTGLSKVLTDVLVATERIPQWLEAPAIGPAELARYYRDERKLAVDTQSLDWAEHRRAFSTQTSLRWRIHRARTYLEMALRKGAPQEGMMG